LGQPTSTTGNSSSVVRRASPEALALMMKNLKGHSKQPKHWVPSGVQTKPEAKTKKIVF
jgi:hypothetical protein